MPTLDEIADVFRRIAEATPDITGKGVCRPSFSYEEGQALSLLGRFATACHLRVRFDAYSNLWVERDACGPGPYHLLGSHVDSVPAGGNYDGLAGCVAAIAALAELPVTVAARSPVRVVCLRGEEGAWYNQPCKGSKLLLGQLVPSAQLKDALAQAEVDYQNPMHQLTGDRLKEVRSFVELHIEQGPTLDTYGTPLGVVTVIAGHRRYDIEVTGEAAHSGTTPMELRKDPLVRAMYLIEEMRRRAGDLTGSSNGESNGEVRVTCGTFHTDHRTEAITKVPGLVHFTLDIRAQKDTHLAEMEGRLHYLAGACTRTTTTVRRTSAEEPVNMNTEVSLRLVDAVAAEAKQPDHRLHSGAGHDAAIFAKAGVPTGMLFVRNQNGSHNPNEAMDLYDLRLGIEALKHYVEATP